ncbi:MAG: aromatic ring-hydroxylating dioxygenase subunit alpha [Betaproteobacteria bacterium]
MNITLAAIVDSYDAQAALAEASTIPAPWYVDTRIAALEQEGVFANNWQVAGRIEQLGEPGRYVTTEAGGEPIVVVRGGDGVLRAFFNVCRHHAAAVVTAAEGKAEQLRCPYHGWTYSLEGALKGAPQFAGVCNFELAQHGLLPLAVATWEKWVFVRVAGGGPPLDGALDPALIAQFAPLAVGRLHWLERRRYTLDCNWKVYVDNYLDGGYHVPHLHKALDGVLEPGRYSIENGERSCLQSSPLRESAGDDPTGAVRKGSRALYYWLYPNFMINWYDGIMDTNLVVPHGADRTEVIFDYYFSDMSESARAGHQASIAVSERIQDEDAAICSSVQRGLNSRAYNAGRLSVRREAGEHLFHRLLHADLQTALQRQRLRAGVAG